MSMLILLARHRIAGEHLATWTGVDTHPKWHVRTPQDPRDPLLVSDLMWLDIVNGEKNSERRAEYAILHNFYKFLGNTRSLQLREMETENPNLREGLTFAFGLAIGAWDLPIMQVAPELVSVR